VGDADGPSFLSGRGSGSEAEACGRVAASYTIGQGVGQRNLAVTANTYTHVLADERELDYANLLA
jgi:hypothetical protein